MSSTTGYAGRQDIYCINSTTKNKLNDFTGLAVDWLTIILITYTTTPPNQILYNL
jgi:hypothetical protein